MSYPARRMRRLRRTPALRRLVPETRLSVDDLVAPLFVREGIEAPRPVASLAGVVGHPAPTTEAVPEWGPELVQALTSIGVKMG